MKLKMILKEISNIIQVHIKTNLENITNILVIKDNIRYEMQFTNIGICDNISLEN